MEMGAFIKEKRMEIGLTQEELGKRLNPPVQKSAVAKWENGLVFNMKRSTIQQLASIFGVSPATFYEDELKFQELDDSVTVNVLGRVAAGCPMLAQEEIIGQIRCSVDQKRGCELFALKIKGDSMEPRIYDGDIVVVRRQDDAVSGDVVIALVDECEDAVCKRYMTYGDTPLLVSLNPKYAPILGKDIKVLGKVIEVRSML